MTAFLRQGYSAGLAADGSRGPARVVQKGVLYLARETQRPILPLAAANSRKITLNTWDHFEVPLPLGRSTLLVDTPLWVSPEDRGNALERHRQILENRLNILFRRSQEWF
jgi:3-deoxy-D-manno-octulosonic-acid transferase